MTIFLASAYAPDSSKGQQEQESYQAELQRCINDCKKQEILLIGTDANASTGTRNTNKNNNTTNIERDQVRGPYGTPYQNKAGRSLYQLLNMNNLCLTNTFFQKHKYNTWHHPSSKIGYQIDHFITHQKHLKRIVDSGIYGIPSKDSDHNAIRLIMKIRRSITKKQKENKIHTRIDRRMLQDPEIKSKFIKQVKSYYVNMKNTTNTNQKLTKSLQQAAKDTLTTESRKQPSWYQQEKDSLEPKIIKRNEAQQNYNNNPTKQNKITLRQTRADIKKATHTAKSKWYDSLFKEIQPKSRPANPREAWEAIGKLKEGKSMTKKVVTMKLKKEDGNHCKSPTENAQVMKKYLNEVFNQTGHYDRDALDLVRQRDPKPYIWMDHSPTDKELEIAIKKLGNDKSGASSKVPAEYYKALIGDRLGSILIREMVDDFWKSGSYKEPTQPPPIQSNNPPNQSINTPTQTQETKTQTSPKKRYYIDPIFGPLEIPQNEYLCEHCNTIITTKYKTKHEKTKKHILNSKIIKTISPIEPTKDEQNTHTDDQDDNDGIIYEEWLAAQLKLLPKKGDLGLCKNWRGICLLEISSKIISSVLVERMKVIQEKEGLEAQSGFRGQRGTIDGLFSVVMGLSKRKEHGLESWALFIDLVKAFDTVNRDLCFKILRKYGFPNHFINIIIRLHQGASINSEFGDTKIQVPSTIGVRQGSCEGPSLFLFMIQAAVETMKWPVPKPEFRTSKDSEVMGANSKRKRGIEKFHLWISLFADDCGLVFETREDLIKGANYLFHHLAKFGLQMHIGRNGGASKTEAMYFPSKDQKYEDGDTSNFNVDDGYVSFTDTFRYLGSLIHNSLTSQADINNRIENASKAFGAIKEEILGNRKISLRIRGKIYVSLILSILLYGSECWFLTNNILNQLKSFHRRCIRSMCRVTLATCYRKRISTTDLLKRMDLLSIENYYSSRFLRWLGHVGRMDMSRTPRKLLTGWVNNSRPIGRPFFNYGHTIKKALKSRNLPDKTSSWLKIAQDRVLWRKLTHPIPQEH